MRKIWDIHGGIHPAENKHQSLQNPIIQAPIPAELVFPLSQHIGAPAQAVVNVGDRVLKGQMIAKANGFVSVPVHASTSGEIVAIEPRPIPHTSGLTGPCIVLKSDGKDEWISHQGIADYTQLDKPALVNLIREAGIAGMGGAGFPTAVKLNTRPDQVIQTLIINGTECEPYITADDILMRERADEIIAGVKILQHLVQPKTETLIGVEDNKPEAIAALRKAANGSTIEIVEFPTKYPSGGEKQLIQILTGKEVPSGKLPGDIGVVVQNVGTAVAVYRAVVHGEPLISRITTVTGDAVARPQNYEVRLGTPMQHVLDLSGFDAKKASRLIMGGPMMGFAMKSTAIPLVKTSNCILVPTAAEIPAPAPAQACIRCGMCAEACPVSLLPQQMYWFAQSQEFDRLQEHNLMDCIECGACSFSCPSNIPLVQYYRASKAAIRQKAEDQRKAEHAKERFEARQARIAQEEAEKEAKRKARLETAKTSTAATDAPAAPGIGVKAAPALDPVQAAIERAKARAAGETVTEPSPLEKAQQQVASLEKRLGSARQKWEAAKAEGSDKLAAFESSVTSLQEKLAAAQAELATLQNAGSPPTTTTDDPAAAAIARAMAKRAGTAMEQDPKEALEQEIASLEKRIINAESKLTEADDSKREALSSSLEKQRTKLVEARAKLAALAPVAESEMAASSDDPAAAAIARAMAKRAAAANMDPKEKLQADITALGKRIDSSRAKLSEAEASGADTVEALRTALAKQEQKLADAQAELASLETQV